MGFHPNLALSKLTESHSTLHVSAWRWSQKHHHFSIVSTSLQNTGLQKPFSAEI